jgi:membrane protease YdiL (CAAX protease family)
MEKNITWPVATIMILLCGLSLPSLSGLLVFPFSIVPEDYEIPYRLANTATFLLLTVATRRSPRFKNYTGVFFSFFAASAALNLQVLSANPEFNAAPIETIAIRMIISTILVAITLIALTLAFRSNLRDIYIDKGKIRPGLLFGSIGFLFFVLTSVPTATYLFGGQNLTLGKALSWSPLVLITVLSNGIREEILYRGIFIRRYGSLFGPVGANIMQAIIFSLSHTVAGRGNVSYTPFTLVLVLFTFILGLAWGYLTQRTNSMLGSIIFHAGSDIPVFLGIFSNL